MEKMSLQLGIITGQKPSITRAKRAISTFNLRAGDAVGLKVTLRGPRMHDFLTRFISIALPRVRDFRGISQKIVDENGNLSIGFREHIAFPEIRSDEVERLHGLQITVSTNAKTRERGLNLFRCLGFPFQS